MPPRSLLMLALLTPILGGCAGNQTDTVSALLSAAEHADLDALNRLIANGVPPDSIQRGDGTALIVAARQGDTAIVDALLRAGARPDLSVTGDGNPLIAAAAAGQHAAAARLIAAKANVNAIVPGDETPLIAAARNGHLDVVELLVAHGADVNLGMLADRGRWRSPLNQAKNAAVHDYLARQGAVAGPTQ